MKSLLLVVSVISGIAISARDITASPLIAKKEIRKPVLHLSARVADDPKFYDDAKNGRALTFGYFDFDSDRLNNYLDVTSSVNSKFDTHYMGISLDNYTNNGKHYDAITGLSFLIPQTVTAGPNDSLQMRLGGWHLTTSMFGYDIIPGEILTLAVAPAVSWGNLKMRREVAGEETKYKNPFVAPGGRAEFRITIGKFSIGARATYRYDLTHSLWKRKDDNMPLLPSYKNNGFAYFGYIGLSM
jgi:hypothetical protein